MDSRLGRIRDSERKSHTEIYTTEKLYQTDSWLKKPIKTVQDIIPLFSEYNTIQMLDLGAGIGRNSIYVANECRDKECRIDCVDLLEIAIEKLMENAVEYGVEHNIRGYVKSIEEYDIVPNTYDLILAVSALEHVDSESTLVRMLEQIQEGTRKNGIVCLVINSEVAEIDADTQEELEPQFEVNLSTATILSYLEEIYSSWTMIKQSVVDQKYDIPRENILSQLSTKVVTFVARKDTGEDQKLAYGKDYNK